MITDTNVHWGPWPFGYLPDDDPESRVAALRQAEVHRAWVGSLDGLLHDDLAAVNARLAQDCQRYGPDLLVPFGTVNPTLPDWREDLRRCRRVHHMPGIRLYPSYHGYGLDQAALAELLRMAAAEKLIVQLIVKMEDERTQHPLLHAPAVDLGPLPALVAELPTLRLHVVNGLRDLNGRQRRALADAGQVYFDIAMLEGLGGLRRLIEQVGLDRVLFGSHFPLFYIEAARLKLRESALSAAESTAVCTANAARLRRW